MNLFIIGPSGCGKSTQAKLIAEKYHLTHLSMGQLLRDAIAQKSPAGLEAKSYIDQGLPVPDQILFPVLNSALEKINNQDFILDGFPRLLSQGQQIEKQISIDLIIHLTVDFLEIVKRRQKLGQEFQDKNRSDNSEQAIANRQKVLYQQNILPILNYFQAKKLLVEIDGNRPIEPIFLDIVVAIDKLKISETKQNHG